MAQENEIPDGFRQCHICRTATNHGYLRGRAFYCIRCLPTLLTEGLELFAKDGLHYWASVQLAPALAKLGYKQVYKPED